MPGTILEVGKAIWVSDSGEETKPFEGSGHIELEGWSLAAGAHFSAEELFEIAKEYPGRGPITFGDSIPQKREPTDLELIELNNLLDQFDATCHEVYALQFNERLEELSRDTGLSIPDIKKRVKEYRDWNS